MGARGRRPGTEPADLLRPRAAGADRVRVLLLGRLEGAPAADDAERAPRPRGLHRRPPRAHLRPAHARHRLDLGEDLVGRVVELGRAAARALPDPVPLLLGLLHAPLLARAGRGAREHLRRLRARRRRADPGLVPRDPARRELHPPGRVHARRAGQPADGDARHRRGLPGRDARARRDAVPERVARQAARRAAAGSCGRRSREQRREVPLGRVRRRAPHRARLPADPHAAALPPGARDRGAGRARRWRGGTMAEFLVWPALFAYSEAAVALGGGGSAPGPRRPARGLGRPARLARADGAARRAGDAGRRASRGRRGRARSTCSPGSSSRSTSSGAAAPRSACSGSR